MGAALGTWADTYLLKRPARFSLNNDLRRRRRSDDAGLGNKKHYWPMARLLPKRSAKFGTNVGLNESDRLRLSACRANN